LYCGRVEEEQVSVERGKNVMEHALSESDDETA